MWLALAKILSYGLDIVPANYQQKEMECFNLGLKFRKHQNSETAHIKRSSSNVYRSQAIKQAGCSRPDEGNEAQSFALGKL